MNEVDAVIANFWLLGIVAAWRVVLMVRTVKTLWGADAVATTAIVLAFSDAVLFTALCLSPMPVLDIMSGNRLSRAEQILADVHFQGIILSFITAPLWLIGLGLPCLKSSWSAPASPNSPPPRISLSGWGLGAGALMIVGWLCVGGQPPLQRATFVRDLVNRDDFSGALSYLAAHNPDDFPPHWDLPPNPNYSYDSPQAARLLRFYLAAYHPVAAPDWVRQRLTEKVLRAFHAWSLADQMVSAASDDDLELLVDSLKEFRDAGGSIPQYTYVRIEEVKAEEQPRRAELLERLRAVLDLDTQKR